MDRDDIKDASVLTVIALSWWTSLVCTSFVLFEHIPVISYHMLGLATLVWLVCQAPKEILKSLKYNDKFGLIVAALCAFLMLFLAVSIIQTLARYYATGDLPEVIERTWPQKWYAVLIYGGAIACPFIYIGSYFYRKRLKGQCHGHKTTIEG